MSDSNELRVKWFGCHLIWDSNDFGCQLIWDSIDLVVKWFEIQMIRLSIDLRFKWFGCQSIWDSNELVVNWFEIQVIWMSNDLRFKWFGCQSIWDPKPFCETSFKNEALKIKKQSFKLWRSKTKLFCETSFKIEALKLQNEAFLRDFLQNWSFQDEKRSFSARLPSKLKLWKSKTKLFCETSFKIDMLSRHLTSELQYVLAIL